MDSRAEVVEAFTSAVAVALRDMAEVDAAARRVAPAAGPGGEDLSAVVRLNGTGTGYLVLGLPAGTAAALAGRVLRESGVDPDDGMVRDCAGELANVVAGQAKALLFGTPAHFTLSTPTVTAGPPDVPPGGEWWEAEFVSDAGGFRLWVRPPG